jgi:hypothetical protein
MKPSIDFEISADGPYSEAFRNVGIMTFSQACQWVKDLHYARNSDRENLLLVIQERQGTCSSKHALLTALAEENARQDIELIAGFFMMGPETHPELTDFFRDKPYTVIPECHCYLRIKGERFDFTGPDDLQERISGKIVREQRIEPQQVGKWKPKIHWEYLNSWLKRNPQIDRTTEEMWAERESCIRILEGKKD